MEVQTQLQTKNYHCNQTKKCPTGCPERQCKVYYIQPPRGQSFAPKKSFCPPAVKFDANTTYYNSYENINRSGYKKPSPSRPSGNLHTIEEPLDDNTTFRMSYQPVWNVVKRKPIIPHKRDNVVKRPMDHMTTIRQDFCKKYAEKSKIIIPCGSISVSSKPFDFTTTSAMSYDTPSAIEPVKNFKPVKEYNSPVEKLSDVTTSKLSYQPLEIPQKEIYNWAQRPKYVRSNVAMDNLTTYCQSFDQNCKCSMSKEKPIIPLSAKSLFNDNDENFIGNTLYNEFFIPHPYTRVSPVIPCNNIALSNGGFSCDTTSKLSYQAAWGEKRTPFLPKQASLLSSKGAMSFSTTNRENFVPKNVEKSLIVIPSDNIHNSKDPFEKLTTNKNSYCHPGINEPLKNFKPQFQYTLPPTKLDTQTVNKLSYKSWKLQPKVSLSWAKKGEYKPPQNPMESESTYCTSFTLPGYFIDESCQITDQQDGANLKDISCNIPHETTLNLVQ